MLALPARRRAMHGVSTFIHYPSRGRLVDQRSEFSMGRSMALYATGAEGNSTYVVPTSRSR